MTTVFAPIHPKKISEQIVGQIKDLISNGALKPGDRIPSERDLATMLSVSRPSVREAITILVAMGFLESRQGGGTFVKVLTEGTITDPLSKLVEENDPGVLRALAEVRMGLEGWSAYLAAERATDADIAELRRLCDIMKLEAAKGGWDTEIDSQFHYAITAASHNSLQTHVLRSIHSLLQATIKLALTEFYKQNGFIDLLLAQHCNIAKAIAERKPDLARQQMMEHLSMVEEKMAELLAAKT
jgi:GntR family transcriptional repressor for pyruvate dehydrogenase complex